MARPQRNRKICAEPRYRLFAPVETSDGETVGCGAENSVTLSLDEYEVIRMVDFAGSTHEQCAVHMGVSRTTVTEMYERARRKIADMLINGKRLCITGGNYSVCNGASPQCQDFGCVIYQTAEQTRQRGPCP